MGERPRLGLATVHGLSMAPTLSPGDRLLVRYGGTVAAGKLVVARFPDDTLVVKRVDSARLTHTGAPGWWLLSDNPADGIDSRHRGALPHDAVIGVVLGRLWPRPGRPSRRRG